MNYTEDQTKYIIEAYREKPNRETVESLAIELGKSIKPTAQAIQKLQPKILKNK